MGRNLPHDSLRLIVSHYEAYEQRRRRIRNFCKPKIYSGRTALNLQISQPTHRVVSRSRLQRLQFYHVPSMTLGRGVSKESLGRPQRCGRSRSRDCRCGPGNNDIDIAANEFVCNARILREGTLWPAYFDRYILSFNVTLVAETLAERVQHVRRRRNRREQSNSHVPALR